MDGEPMECECNISQYSPHCSSATESNGSCQKWAHNQKISQDGLFSCRCSTTSHGDLPKRSKNANQALNSFQFVQRFSPGRWSFLGFGSEKKLHSISEDSPQGEWDKMAEKMMSLLNANHKENGQELMMFKFGESIETVFRAIISVHQLNI